FECCCCCLCACLLLFAVLFFFCDDPATTEIYTLSLHDALPISRRRSLILALRAGTLPESQLNALVRGRAEERSLAAAIQFRGSRSEEHTSELQSRENLVCRLLLEKKKKKTIGHTQRQQTKTTQR